MCSVCCINQQQAIELSYFHSAKSWKLPGCEISAVDVLEEHWKERQVTSVTELIFFYHKEKTKGKGWKRPTQSFYPMAEEGTGGFWENVQAHTNKQFLQSSNKKNIVAALDTWKKCQIYFWSIFVLDNTIPIPQTEKFAAPFESASSLGLQHQKSHPGRFY